MWLPVLKNNSALIGKGIALVGALSAFSAYSAWIYGLGEKNQRAETQAEQVRLANEHQLEIERKISEALQIQADDYDAALERAKNEREIITKTEEVIRYVERTNTIPAECDQLAADVVSVLQQSSSIVRAAASPRGADTE